MCCCNIRQADPPTRRIYRFGCLCLSSGLLLSVFAKDFGLRHPALYDSLRFLLLGAAICLLLWSIRRRKQCAPRP